ncbi:ATPase, histidine kinase-, DNA gyrase B (macronuclear) [Tetrahymena thermophila SB210]|uniref:histidine kinase n=1 Tax=Tetrahymena thermophila (strain SB210) TaxID=312017 RepID=Q22MQ8_TETTS|nr:ATPase, histidine kinase-, DNA gyrase B [Tetrahymena thermophila SB210]EAR86641.2 ATPase, histidine kinase-, DNA gyrase B [Tetrahymena thermophila SB210]|eukprot:XP_976962.2 ATPase, histidine kinase-, DNA gyrase B [Tetrahymena thermophila SB210]
MIVNINQLILEIQSIIKLNNLQQIVQDQINKVFQYTYQYIITYTQINKQIKQASKPSQIQKIYKYFKYQNKTWQAQSFTKAINYIKLRQLAQIRRRKEGRQVGRAINKMKQKSNLKSSLSQCLEKVSKFCKKQSKRLSFVYLLLIVVNIMQYFYARSVFNMIQDNSKQEVVNNDSNSQKNSDQYSQNCVSSIGQQKINSSQFPGTCIKSDNIQGFSVLCLLFLIDGAFNLFNLIIQQCQVKQSIIQFLNRYHQKIIYNIIENSLQFVIIYYGDDKILLLSCTILFVKNILTLQYNLRNERILQFIIILLGSILNMQFRSWSVYVQVSLILTIIETFVSFNISFKYYGNINLQCNDDCSIRMQGMYCLKHNQHKFNSKEEDNNTYNAHRSSKILSYDKQRNPSSKKRIDHFEQNSNVGKSNIDDNNDNNERINSKRTSKNPFLMQLSKNFSQKADKRESNQTLQNQNKQIKKKSSLENMVSKTKPNKKVFDKEVEVLDNTHQYSHVAINRGDQSNSFSSIYDKNCKNKNAFMRYRTTSPGLKNDGTISIDQSKSKQVFVSSAGQIPSAVTHTIYSGQSLPKSHKNIGKKPLLNLSEIKGLKFSEKFKQFNKKIPSKKLLSNLGQNLNSRIKLDQDDINSQNGKRNIIYPNQSIQLKSKNQQSLKEIDSQSILSPKNNVGILQEDLKNQFSTKNLQNSSSRLLYHQLNELNNNPYLMNNVNNQEQKNFNYASQGLIGERQNQNNAQSSKRNLQDQFQPKQIESEDTESMFNYNNGGSGYLKEFYGMFFQILSEGIILFNFENGDININYTLKRLLNCHNDKECVEILFSLKNASLQPLNHSTEGPKSQNLNDDGVGQNSNNPEINHFNSSFMNINSYMYDNSLFTASKNRTYEEQTTSNNQKVPTQKSQKSINIHSNYTYQNQITNSNNLNDDVLSQIKRRHSTSSYHKTNTLMSRKTTRFQYKKDEDELNSSAEVENSPVQQQTKIKVNSGIFSSNINGFQLQLDGPLNGSTLQNNMGIRDVEVPQKNTVKLNNKTNQAQKQPDSGLQIDESLNQEYIGSNNMFDRQQLQQQFQQIYQSNYQNDYQIERDEDDFKLKRKEIPGSGMTATASPQLQQQQTYHHTQTHSHNSKQNSNQPFQKIIYSVAKEFTVKDQLEKIEEDMHDYTNESNYEMLGHHIKMLCKLDCKNLNQNKQNHYETQATTNNPQNMNTPIQNMNQQPNYYHSSVSYNQISSLNPFQHQNSAFIDGLKNRKTSRFSNLSALNPFQQQSTVQFIQQQMQQIQTQNQNKNDDKKIIEITFIPCYVNKQKCLVLVVKDVSHFNSIKVLKEMNENRSKMLNYVVHEIRSPLSSIMNYLHSSIESLTKELYDQFIDPALSSAQMLNVLIQDLLDMAQMKAGKYRLNIRPFKIENLIEDVKKTMRVIVKQKSQDINLESYIDPLITSDISSDQLRIKQILINLISNAVKFTDEGSIRIEVNMIENKIYRFSVRDTGIGITDDQKKKLFSEFSKIETTQTDILNPKGVGLGLVISNILAKSLAPKHMPAGLEIISGKSKGSEFFFHILDFSTQNNNNNNNTILNNQSSIVPSDQNILLTRTAKLNGSQQTKLNNISFVHTNTNSIPIQSQMSPTNRQIMKTDTQVINSLFPYTKGGSSDAVLDQEFYLQEQDNLNSNKRNFNNQSSSSPSSNSSSSPSSRKNSASVPIDEEDIDINIQYISPKFKKNRGEQNEKPNIQQQMNMQVRFLSSSAVGSDYVKNAEMSGQNNSLNNNVNFNNNNYSFIQNSLSRDPNKPQSLSQSQQQQQNIQNMQLQQVASSYFNFEDNNQQGTASLPMNSVQSLRFGFQSLQHNSQPSSSLQQDGLLNIPANFDLKNKYKKKCNCSNILIVDDETFQCNSLSQLIHSITKQQCDKATSCDSCLKHIVQKHQQNQCCPSYQLILLDLNMFPSKDGFETLIEIQKYHTQVRLQMPKVVACTGEADEEKKQQCIIAGFIDILEKPIQVDQLKSILTSYYFQNQIQQYPQQFIFQNTMSQLSFNQQLQVINM